MIEKLKDRHNRRTFVVLLALIAIILLIGLWQWVVNKTVLNPVVFDMGQSLITSILSTVFTAIFMGAMYFWLLPKEETLAQVKETDPQTTIEYFDNALKRTTFWGYHGHIGRWVRNSAIPSLVKSAEERGETINICLILIDPADSALCSAFQKYKNNIRFREQDSAGSQSVAVEIYTTIVKCLYYIQTCSSANLHIEVYLARHFSALRKDISDTLIFMTRIDPRAPALVVPKPAEPRQIEMLFSALRTEFDYSKQTSRKVNFSAQLPAVTTTPTKDTIREVVSGLSILEQGKTLDENLCAEIASRFCSDYHPYH